MPKQYSRGAQIAYVPHHAKDDISHYDVEFGFVTAQRGNTVFCRYWSRSNPNELRTKANSEGADVSLIRPYISHDQDTVDELLKVMP